ncbi:class I SAM-dependent methyltransferase [Actinospongicola halichondriae]|uniref:class I SAM-dependent methyltransferase n=1 Tax=Actinospongicola halichondriae TaxID=3236844 RepID=UPI003D484421
MTENSDAMTDAERGQVNAEAAEIYDAFFVPALFGQFSEPVLDRAGVEVGDRVLDVGCGTGILARAARCRVGPTGQVAGVDPNDGMLTVARRADDSVDWRQGVAERLPFGDTTFTRTVSQFAAMFFVDRAQALKEMARVTASGGTVTTATWSRLEHTPGYEAMVSLINDELGDAAADALRAPFILGEPGQVRDLLSPFGPKISISEVDGTARFSSIADWVHTDVRGWTLADLVDDEAEATLINRAERELARFVASDGTVTFPAPAIVASVTIDH